MQCRNLFEENNYCSANKHFRSHGTETPGRFVILRFPCPKIPTCWDKQHERCYCHTSFCVPHMLAKTGTWEQCPHMLAYKAIALSLGIFSTEGPTRYSFGRRFSLTHGSKKIIQHWREKSVAPGLQWMLEKKSSKAHSFWGVIAFLHAPKKSSASKMEGVPQNSREIAQIVSGQM